jgi:hypothetical protein
MKKGWLFMRKSSDLPEVVLLLHLCANAFAAPYPSSTYITGLTFDDKSTVVRKAPGSDNYPFTWADDNNQYAAWGDGGGFGGTNDDGRVSLGVARIEGTPADLRAFNVWGGKNAENPATLRGKTYGMLSVGGVLYMVGGEGVNSDGGWDAAKETRVWWSTDHSKTWQRSEIYWTYQDGIGYPALLNFGKDYAGARDDYVYMYSYDVASGEVGTRTDIILLRVHKDSMENKSDWEFFSGTADSPAWTKSASSRKPVFTDDQKGVNTCSVTYNPAIGRYLLVVPHGTPSRPEGGLGIFDAPEPWGPWTTVFYEDAWNGSKHMFFACIPSKMPDWMSDDGKRMYLVFTGYNADGEAWAQDAYQHLGFTITLGETGAHNRPVAARGAVGTRPPSSSCDNDLVRLDGRLVKRIRGRTGVPVTRGAGLGSGIYVTRSPASDGWAVKRVSVRERTR